MTYRQELARKAIHLSHLAIPLGYAQFSEKVIIAGVAFLSGMMIGIDLWRTRSKWANKYYMKFFKPMMRQYEHSGKHLTGATYMAIAALAVILIVGELLGQKTIALAVLSITIAADAAAALVGKQWGTIKIWKETSLQGSLACFVTAFAIAHFWGLPIHVSLIGAAAATLAEIFTFGLNDNVTIPLATSLAMLLVS